MTRIKVLAVLWLLVIAGLFLYWRLHKHDTKVDEQISSLTLPPDVTTKLLIDNVHHTVTTIKRRTNNVGGTDEGAAVDVTGSYLNPRGVLSIEETKSGALVISQRTMGTEVSPFGGVALGSDVKLRGIVGVNLYYLHGFDVGAAALSSGSLADTRLSLTGSYNAYDPASVGLAVDNRKTVHLFVSVRF